MRFDIISIFPEFFTGPLDYGIVRRAREAKLVETKVHDLRAFTHDRHKTVDDRPFGGGEGMVMKPEPLFEAVESLVGVSGTGADRLRAGTAIVLLSAAGRLFRQEAARRFAGLERMVLICGRYEGVDERVAEHLATDEISIGDFVLSGGELAAAMVLDAVTRLIPGALGNEDSAVNESFSEVEADSERARHGSTTLTRSAVFLGTNAQSNRAGPRGAASDHVPASSQESRVVNYGILDYPHYTRPPSFRGWEVPETLMSGNHEEIRRWRRNKAIEKTLRNRPELLDGAKLER